MKLFISWSGDRSKLLAESLRSWLPGVINAVEPWLSSSDIDPGARWGPELANQLETTKYGIICLTSENLNAPWILFEAGALSKYVQHSRVVPLLLDVKPTEIKGPLAQFQAIQTNENDIKKLVSSINLTVFEAGEKGIDSAIIDQAYALWWPKLKEVLDGIPKSAGNISRRRPEREMIEEILITVRGLQRSSTLQGTSLILDGDLLREVIGSLPEPTRVEVLRSLIDQIYTKQINLFDLPSRGVRSNLYDKLLKSFDQQPNEKDTDSTETTPE